MATIFSERRRKGIADLKFGVRTSVTEAEASTPTITSGSGAPSASEPNGSVYMRTGGTSSTTVYARASGSWVAIATPAAGNDYGAGGLLSDVIAESTAAAGVTIDGVLLKDGDILLVDNDQLKIGTGSDIVFAWDATRLNVTQALADSEIRWGVDGAGIDQRWYGDTASTSLLWDQSADKLVLNGVAKIQLQTIAAATGTAIPVTHSGLFPITQNGAETNTLADPTFLGQQLDIFVDTDTSGARVITAASRINQAGNVTITLTEVGDYIRLVAITIAGALKWQVVSNDGAALS